MYVKGKLSVVAVEMGDMTRLITYQGLDVVDSVIKSHENAAKEIEIIKAAGFRKEEDIRDLSPSERWCEC
jgi:hypothetical protein